MVTGMHVKGGKVASVLRAHSYQRKSGQIIDVHLNLKAGTTLEESIMFLLR